MQYDAKNMEAWINDNYPASYSSFSEKSPTRVVVPKDQNILYVKTLTGMTHVISCKPEDAIKTIKAKIGVSTGNSPELQRLIFSGRQIEDDQTASDCNLEDGSTLHLVLRVRGINVDNSKPPVTDDNTDKSRLSPFIKAALAFTGCQLLAYGAACLRPEAELPLKVSIPISLLIAALAGAYACQGQGRA